MAEDTAVIAYHINGHCEADPSNRATLSLVGDDRTIQVRNAEIVAPSLLRVALADGTGHLLVPADQVRLIGLYAGRRNADDS